MIRHMRLDIKGALANWKKRDFEKMLKDNSGRSLSADEAREALMDELLKGHRYLPMAECPGFDPKEKGCPGHEGALKP